LLSWRGLEAFAGLLRFLKIVVTWRKSRIDAGVVCVWAGKNMREWQGRRLREAYAAMCARRSRITGWWDGLHGGALLAFRGFLEERLECRCDVGIPGSGGP